MFGLKYAGLPRRAGPQVSIPKRVDNAGIEKTKFGRLQRAISLDRTDTRACSRRAAPFPT